MILYEQFYRHYGIRKGEQLLTPPLAGVDVLQLPRESILHYVGSSSTDMAPPSDDYIFRQITKPIMMRHITDNGDMRGSPRRLSVMPDNLIRAYHTKNRRFRKLHDLEAGLRDPLTLVVVNYGFIPQMYHYMRSVYSGYYKWWNIQAALWKEVSAIAEVSPRQQYIRCGIPSVLPSVATMMIGEGDVSQRMMKLFDTQESLTLLELWKWFGPHRETSVMNAIPEKQLSKVNLIFTDSGRWFVMNLGVLNSWRTATEAELEKNPDANTVGIGPKQIQRRFLRLMMSLSEVRSVAAPEVNTDDVVVDDTAVGNATPSTIPVEVQSTMVPVMNKTTGTIEMKTSTINISRGQVEDTTHSEGAQHTGHDIVHDERMDEQLAKDLEVLEMIAQNASAELRDAAPSPAGVQFIPAKEAQQLEDGVLKVCSRLAESGAISAAEYVRYNKLAASYKTIMAPDGKSTMEHFVKIPKEMLEVKESAHIPNVPTVIDKTMQRSSLVDFDSRYIKHVLARDVAMVAMSIQNAGHAVTHYEVEKVDDVLGGYDSHTIRYTPVDGAAGTLRFKLPAMQEDGTYMANGVRYRLRKQRGDMPIRKVAPDRVALTSYYGKAFVSRTSKRVANRGVWLRNAVMAKAEDAGDTTVLNARTGNVFDNGFISPRLYSTMAMGFRGFDVAGYELNFDHSKRVALYGHDALQSLEKDGSLVIGKNTKGHFMLLDRHDTIYTVIDGVQKDVGSLEDLIHLDQSKAPVDFVELRALGQPIPIGVVMAYEMGFDRLMSLLGVEPRRVPAGSRVGLELHEYSIAFADETLVFSRDDKVASLILAGFNDYHKAIRNFDCHQFDKRAVYLNVLEANQVGARYIREIDLMYQMFVDAITRELLIEMGEPTDFPGLLFRAVEMLLHDQHPDELDPAFMRIKGYERLAGAVYGELVRTIRSHNGRSGKSKVPLDMGPYAVWKTITTDPANALVSEINPIQNLKEMEMVTTSGVGGRGSRSMTKHTRAYHRNDMGTMSESTVDSSDVGINTQLSADPQFTSLRGMSKRYKVGETGATALLSTSALLCPGSDRDDPKRVNFIAIQASHAVSCDGYVQQVVRTGYEGVVPQRTGDLFAMAAKQDGKVISVTEDGIVVEYADGTQSGHELGRRFGAAAGLTIPHTLITDMKAGQKFQAGEMLCYNSGFFEKDILNPKGVIWKAGVTTRVALLESTQTLEDSASISPRIAKLLSTPMTKTKVYTVGFDQSVRRLVKVGDRVESEDILCIIEDAVTAGSDLFDESTLDTLRVLSAQAPQAKVKGVVERIEAFYHGDMEDMSESLRAIAKASDKELMKRGKAVGRKGYTGSVDEGFRVDGTPLALDTMAIRVYITSSVPAGVGDKGVFCNQMKTVFGEVLPGEVVTESGLVVDAIFGAKSIADRIVTSPEVIGTTTTLLDVLAKKALKAYRS